jgi:ABC-type transport system involved in multi-copper enzyme maturation permease subunit
MNFLPIVERELRVAARRPEAHRVRVLFLALTVALWFFLWIIHQHGQAPTTLSRNLYEAMSVIAFSFAIASGLIFAADTLSAEKRAGTLGLLFLTDLKGYDVMLGKLAAHSLNGFYGLLGMLPVLALPLLMGGVSLGEFARLALALLATMFQSLGVAMYISALCRETQAALLGTFFVLLTLAGVFPMLWWLINVRVPGADWLLLPSPGYTLRAAVYFSYQVPKGAAEFWLSFSVVCLSGMAGLALASSHLAKVWHEQSPIQNFRLLRIWRARVTRAVACEKQRKPSLNANPYAWLAHRDPGCAMYSLPMLWLAMPIWFLGLLWAIIAAKSVKPTIFIFCLLGAYTFHQVAKLLLAIEVTRQVMQDRQNGNLELLRTTPLPATDIVAGVRFSTRLKFNSLRRCLLAMNGLLFLSVLFFHQRLSINVDRELAIFLLIFVCGMLLLHYDCRAIFQTSLASALGARQPNRAALFAMGKVMGAAWLAIFLLVFFILGGGGNDTVMTTFMLVWTTLSILWDRVLTRHAQRVIQRWIQSPT